MDRISALRNVEEALRTFEAGEADLERTQQQVQSVLQSYATEFEAADRRPYRAHGDEPADGIVVVAPDPEAAKQRVQELQGVDPSSFDVEPL